MKELVTLRAVFAPHKKRCAVYLLIDNDTVAYVGQSQDVDTRLAQHRRGGEAFNEVLILEVDASDLLAYEAALIRALRPRSNKSVSSDRQRDAEILTRLGLPLPPRRVVVEIQEREGDSKFSLAIRRARKGLNMSMRTFAAHLGVSAANVCEWESGKHATPTSRIATIAQTLGIEPSELV